MFGVLYTSQDVVSSAMTGALLMTFSTAILCFLGLSWSNEKWRVPVAMVGSRLSPRRSTMQAPPRSGCKAAHPRPGSGSRAGTPFTRFRSRRCISTLARRARCRWACSGASRARRCSWYFRAGSATPGSSTPRSACSVHRLLALYPGRDVLWRHARGCAQIEPRRPPRLLLGAPADDIGWAIYPILHFVDVVIGTGQAPGVVALYTLFDLVNLITRLSSFWPSRARTATDRLPGKDTAMTGADAIALLILLTILIAVGVYLLHWLYRHSPRTRALSAQARAENGWSWGAARSSSPLSMTSPS